MAYQTQAQLQWATRVTSNGKKHPIRIVVVATDAVVVIIVRMPMLVQHLHCNDPIFDAQSTRIDPITIHTANTRRI